jgi:hypothetical protein
LKIRWTKYVIKIKSNAAIKAFSACLVLITFSTLCQTTFTYRGPSIEGDQRFEYDHQLLKLALDKTTQEYGRYFLLPSYPMNGARTRRQVENGTYANYFPIFAFRQKYANNLDYVPVPTHRGIVGYRIFLTNKQSQLQLSNVNSLNDLKPFTIVQGQGWLDTDILLANGLNVLTLTNYESLFFFIDKGRGDLFPRGIHEIQYEYQHYKTKVSNFKMDNQIALYYPAPRFFYTSKGNQDALLRIFKGLQLAWADGSFITLWKKYYQSSIDQAQMSKRQIIELDNPEVRKLSNTYKKYMYRVRKK